VVLTLATSYDSVYRDLLVHFVVAPGVFIFGVVLASFIAGRRWNRAFTWLVVWGLAFPFVRLLLLNVEGRQFAGNSTRATWAWPLCASLVYLWVVLVVRVVRLKKWSFGFTCAIAFALMFPLARLMSMSIAGGRGVIGGNAFATVLSAVLLWRATRSWVPVAGCAAGLLVAGVGFEYFLLPQTDRLEVMWAASLAWNACVFASLMAWAHQCHPKKEVPGRCSACGYDLRGTPGRPCPECGKWGVEQEVGTWS
jgi:hypothetical protein